MFRAGSQAAIVVASGAVRVDVGKAAAALGCKLDRADAAFVRDPTGFAIGGVSPIAHTAPCLMVLDEDLLALDPIWAAAGSPNHVFSTTASLAGAVDRRAVRRCRAETGYGMTWPCAVCPYGPRGGQAQGAPTGLATPIGQTRCRGPYGVSKKASHWLPGWRRSPRPVAAVPLRRGGG